MKDNYYTSILMVEKLHRLFLEVLKYELNKHNIRDINNVQALLLYNIGTSKLTVGELTSRGYYQGTNVTYNLRKIVENGYILQTPVVHDRRSSEVRLTEKGIEMYEIIGKFFADHSKNLEENNFSNEMINNLVVSLNFIESYLNKIGHRIG